MNPAKTRASINRKWKLIFCLIENKVIIFPAPKSTPNESRMIGSGVRNLENDKENTAVTYMMRAIMENMLNQKKIFFSV